MPTEHHTCGICGSNDLQTLKNRGHSYARCDRCGFLFRTGEVSRADVTEFYTSGGGNPLGNVDRAKRALHLRTLRRAERKLGGPGRLLDVGCSSGVFLELAKSRGWDAVGVEPVEELVEAGRACGLDLHAGTLAEVELEESSFDLITYWDVLVLVEDPVGEMQRVRSLLTTRGLWYARLRQHAVLRAVDTLWPVTGGLLGVRNPVVYHPCNFEPRTIYRLLARTKFTGRVFAGRLTAGDAYGTAPGWMKSVLSAGKSLIDVFARTLDQITGGRLVLSPTMEVWAKRRS